MAIKFWLAYLLQQFAAAAAALCAVLALSEILMPSSVLPYFNLHALIIGTLVLCLISPALPQISWWRRLLATLPLAILIIAFVVLTLLNGGMAAQAVMLAICGMMVLVLIALCHPERSEGSHSIVISSEVERSLLDPSPFEDVIPAQAGIQEEIVEIVEVIETAGDDTSVFMR